MTNKRMIQTDPSTDSEEQAVRPEDEAAGTATSNGTVSVQPDRQEARDEATRQRDEYYDLLLRKTAEFENYRKRIDRERRESQDYAAMALLEELLPVVDDLERALRTEATTPDSQAYRQGVGLIHRQLLELLRKRGATPIETIEQSFDPRYHQAVAHEHSPGHRDGEIVEEVRRGYMLKDRLLRPALVKVAKA